VQIGQITDHCADIKVLGTHSLLADRQGALEQLSRQRSRANFAATSANGPQADLETVPTYARALAVGVASTRLGSFQFGRTKWHV
jgi:hypothetical protein